MAGVLLVLVMTACTGTGREDRAAVAANQATPSRAATEVLGATGQRPISVTPFERTSFLEVAVPAPIRHGRAPVLHRWVRSPSLRIVGATTGDDLRRVGEAVDRWNVITGLRMTAGGSGDAAIVMHFVPREQFARVLGIDRADPTAVGLTRLTLDPDRRGVIRGAEIVVASDDLQVSRNRTIAHELGHAIGLQHSTCPSSLMDGSANGTRSVRWTPTALDIRLTMLLYDPRLAPGMTRGALEDALVPDAVSGATCDPVDLELVRAAGSGRHYLCEKSDSPNRACTADLSSEPALPLSRPDAWTDGSALSSRPLG